MVTKAKFGLICKNYTIALELLKKLYFGLIFRKITLGSRNIFLRLENDLNSHNRTYFKVWNHSELKQSRNEKISVKLGFYHKERKNCD